MCARRWGLKCNEGDSGMKLHFESFDTESSFDYVTVYDVSTRTCLLIAFHADGSICRRDDES
jgi:hypothetical protein